MEPSVDDKLHLLRNLLSDYSYPEKRTPGMLRQIDSLLSWALAEVVTIGSSSSTVEKILGTPHLLFGDESSERSRWFYPCVPTEQEAARTPQWFFSLEFHDGLLQSIERRGWIS